MELAFAQTAASSIWVGCDDMDNNGKWTDRSIIVFNCSNTLEIDTDKW